MYLYGRTIESLRSFIYSKTLRHHLMPNVFLEKSHRFGSNPKADKHLPHTGSNHV